MARKKKVSLEKKREVSTYAEMWHTSYCLLEKGLDDPKGSFHQLMASIVFTAFTFEAYMNHIGAKLYTCWDDLERLSPREKLNVIAEHLDVGIDEGRRPWQVIKKLFQFRNDIAHGKSIKIRANEVYPLKAHSDERLHGIATTRWEDYCTKRNAKRAREDVEAIVEILHQAAGFEDDFPFVSGFQLGHGTIIDE